VRVTLQAFQSSALYAGKWWASRSDCFTPERFPLNGWAREGLHVVTRTSSRSSHESNAGRAVYIQAFAELSRLDK
jgi:hypothetical protein